MGISEIQIPLSYSAIDDKKIYFIARETESSGGEGVVESRYKTFPVIEGRFGQKEQVLKMFEKIPKSLIDIKVDEKTHRAQIKIGTENILMSPGLKDFLGGMFSPRGDGPYEREFWRGRTYYGLNPVRYSTGLDRIYVYCDLVKPRIVGDAQVELLTAIPSPVPKENGNDFGEIYTIRFPDIRYLEVGKNFAETIRITLRDGMGRKIPFKSGKVLIELAFRKE